MNLRVRENKFDICPPELYMFLDTLIRENSVRSASTNIQKMSLKMNKLKGSLI